MHRGPEYNMLHLMEPFVIFVIVVIVVLLIIIYMKCDCNVTSFSLKSG